MFVIAYGSFGKVVKEVSSLFSFVAESDATRKFCLNTAQVFMPALIRESYCWQGKTSIVDDQGTFLLSKP